MPNEQTIIEVAERLLAESGRMPTVEAVREALGGGSFSTISPVLRTWRRQQQAANAASVEIPPRVRDALERVTGALWSAFRDEIEERAARARNEAEKRASEAESEREQALQEVARLEAALSAAKAETEASARDREAARAALARAREENATLSERTRQQETRLADLAAKLERTEASAGELRSENARLAERAGYADELREQIKALRSRPEG